MFYEIRVFKFGFALKISPKTRISFRIESVIDLNAF